MVKEISELKNQARYILVDKEYIEFESFLSKNQWTSLRCYISDLLEEEELDLMLDGSTDCTSVKELNKLQDMIIDIIINQNDVMDDGGRRNRIIRGAIST
jgi:hypothetical protein